MKQLFSLLLAVTLTTFANAQTETTKTIANSSTVYSDENLNINQSASIDTGILKKMTEAIINQAYPNIHSVLINQKGHLVYEAYFKGKDEEWGTDAGIVVHTKNTLHDLRSVSKSVVSACIGIAISKGMIKSVNERVFSFFPQYASLDTGVGSSLTIEHLLTMSSGIVWNEDVPYTNPANSELQMIKSPDPVKFVLSQPFNSTPGKVWGYNGGTTQLLASIIQKVSGLTIDQFAVKYLFSPLGIDQYEWKKYPGTNIPAAASGLRLLPRDMVKLGLLYMNNGNYNSKQILDSNWVKQSLQSHVSRGSNGSYGYQFWIVPDDGLGNNYPLVACIGNGDQRIYIDKPRDLVVVVTAGNYNVPNVTNGSYQLLRDFIYPALKK